MLLYKVKNNNNNNKKPQATKHTCLASIIPKVCISTLGTQSLLVYPLEVDFWSLVSLPWLPWLHIFSGANIRRLGCRQLNQQAWGSSVCDQGWSQAKQTQFEYLRDNIKSLYDPAAIGLLQAPPIIPWHRAGSVSPPMWVSVL